jgi:hypothetical protein
MVSAHHFHICSFKGKSNCSKLKVLLVLEIAQEQGIVYLTAGQIQINTGVNKVYLLHRLRLWVKWHYLIRRGTPGAYRYRIATRGSYFLTIVPTTAYLRAYKELGEKET